MNHGDSLSIAIGGALGSAGGMASPPAFAGIKRSRAARGHTSSTKPRRNIAHSHGAEVSKAVTSLAGHLAYGITNIAPIEPVRLQRGFKCALLAKCRLRRLLALQAHVGCASKVIVCLAAAMVTLGDDLKSCVNRKESPTVIHNTIQEAVVQCVRLVSGVKGDEAITKSIRNAALKSAHK